MTWQREKNWKIRVGVGMLGKQNSFGKKKKALLKGG